MASFIISVMLNHQLPLSVLSHAMKIKDVDMRVYRILSTSNTDRHIKYDIAFVL